MNPDFHEQFVALCALYYSDEITEEEWALLQVHMAYCEPCKQRFLDYQKLATDVIPMMAAAAAASDHDGILNETSEDQRLAAEQLINNLEDLPQIQETTKKKRLIFPQLGLTLAACSLGCLALVSVYLLRTKGLSSSRALQSPTPANTVAPYDASTTDQQMLRQDRAEIQNLHQQLSMIRNSFAHLVTKDQTSQHQILNDEIQIKQLTAELDSLSEQFTASQNESQILREHLLSSAADANQNLLKIASLETKLRDVDAALDDANTALNERERMLALDRDFLAHDRDVRDVISARDLYIADVYDSTESGRYAKPFARIFYTRDRSLIFYGFDLEKQSGLKQDASFQVWGSGSDQKPVSLGLLYQDDNHNRWVMRFNDSKTLARLNMVFVTIEPPGGSRKPTGKQMLRALLQMPPNHP
ncbi:anti-sigma factor domain-containing protein [Silvibacterium sp.]|uniref:anti-sigma factor n=1 Tax=Silvibacterium sp. TaxID=1964179 RepID=UPI0039E257D3